MVDEDENRNEIDAMDSIYHNAAIAIATNEGPIALRARIGGLYVHIRWSLKALTWSSRPREYMAFCPVKVYYIRLGAPCA